MTSKKTIKLALQGSGSHSAFTCGALERLLDEDDLVIESISATSMGAIIATVFAYGMIGDEPKKAKHMMENLWRKLSLSNSFHMPPNFMEKMLGFSPSSMAIDYFSKIFSPYQYNFLDFNPVRNIIKEMIDFNQLKHSKINLFFSATNVKNGDIKIFNHKELDLDKLMACCNSPFFFKSAEIGGEYYWDGVYSGYPPIFPLIIEGSASDIILIKSSLNNIEEIPTQINDIIMRALEISSNSVTTREINAFQQDGKAFFHLIESEELISSLGRASKMNFDGDFLHYLQELGSQASHDWLSINKQHLGKKSTVTNL